MSTPQGPRGRGEGSRRDVQGASVHPCQSIYIQPESSDLTEPVDHEAGIIEAARNIAAMELSDDPAAAAKAAEALELAQASLEVIWALRPIIEEGP